MTRERVETGGPESGVLLEPAHRVPQRTGRQRHAMHPAFDGAGQQSRVFEHADVLRDRGQRDLERLGQLRHRRGPARQPRQDRAPRRVRERAEDRIQRVRVMLNHVVNYRTARGAGQEEKKLAEREGFEPSRRY